MTSSANGGNLDEIREVCSRNIATNCVRMDLCSSLHCNICLVLQTTSKNDGTDSSASKLYSQEKLLTCNGCQLVKYCKKSHQMIDWNFHREFCQAIQKIKQTLTISHPLLVSGEAPKCKNDIERIVLQLKYRLRNSLGRALEFQEEELTSYPVYCPICFRFRNVHTLCEECKSQAYCSKEHLIEHRNVHMKVCGFLELYYTPFKIIPADNYAELTIKQRVEDFQNIDLIEAFERCFKCKLPAKPTHGMLDYQILAYAANFSCIFTICYALCHMDPSSYSSNENFVIFIIGASIEAAVWFLEIHCRFFFLQYPQFMELNLHFIGPEVVDAPKEILQFEYKAAQRTVRFHSYRGVFQNYCRHFKVKPSMIVAYNCGFSEYSHRNDVTPSEPLSSQAIKDTWYFGLVEILQTFDTPIIFTSFTKQESDFDFSALVGAVRRRRLKVNIDRIFKVAKNPYRDIRPLRQFYVRDEESIYYRNGYIQAIRTKLMA